MEQPGLQGGGEGVEGRAGDGIRTRDNRLGRPILYQLSYTRVAVCASYAHQPEPDNPAWPELARGVVGLIGAYL